MLRTVCPEKKTNKNVLCNIFHEIWYKVSRINLLQKYVNVFHLTWILSLHYLVKLEILITRVLPLRCQRKQLQNFSHLNCGLQIRQIWIQLITACGNDAREVVQSMHHWSGWIETATEKGVGQAGSCRHCSSHLSVVSSIAAGQCCVFAIFSNRCYQLDSNFANLDAAVEVE